MYYVRVTRGTPGKVNSEGLEPLRMALWNSETNLEEDHVVCYSGAPGAQHFRTLANEVRGVLEPIPEGTYREIGQLEWKNGANNYNDYWSSSLGPVVVQIYGERAIMLHLDANRSYAPGSAGCLCPIDLTNLKKVVTWWQLHKITYVECDWGLGTIKKTAAGFVPKDHPLNKVKFFYNSKGSTAYQNDKEVTALELNLDYHSNLTGLNINGKEVPKANLESIQVIVMYK